jgi:hypothetical protein
MSILNLNTVRLALPHLLDLAKGIPGVGAVVAVGDLVHEIVGSFGPHDQETLKADIAKLSDENDAGHQRLQDKLAAAAKR